MSLDRRVHLLLDQAQYDKVAAVAQAHGWSVGSVIRDAIHRGLTIPDDRKAAAGARILAAEPHEAPELDDLLAELDDLRGRRA